MEQKTDYLKSAVLWLIAAAAFIPDSCSEDFLTREPPGVGTGSSIMTPDGVESLLTGTYAAMKGTFAFGGSMGTDWVYGSVVSDDCYKGTSAGDSSPMSPIERYENEPYNSYFRQRWSDCYNGVSRANSVLDVLEGAQAGKNPLTPVRALQVMAEARFLRAWFHFQANKVFEHIPYIKTEKELYPLKPEEVTNPDPAWDPMEEDLRFAIQNLPENFPKEPGRADKYAAEAVLAHALMYQKKYAQAKTLLDDIINNGGFQLAPDFYDNYDMTHENNCESIFEIEANTTSSMHNSLLVSGAVFHQKGPSSCGGWGFFQPSQILFEAFQVDVDGLPVLDINERAPLENDMDIASNEMFVPTSHLLDPRVDWTIARRGIDFLGWGIHPGNDWIREQANGGPYMTKKYMHKKSEQLLNGFGTGFYNGKNYRLYRLANILLWRAEVAVEQNDRELARELVNMIRERAGSSTPVMGYCSTRVNPGSDPVVDWSRPAANYKIGLYPPGHEAFSSLSEARKAVRMELRLEFATEGHRFFALRRWGIDGEVLSDFIERDVKFRTFMRGSSYDSERNDYWPLPQDQVEMQKNVLVQDSSYIGSR